MKPLHANDQPDSSPTATSVLSVPYASASSESVASDFNTMPSSVSGVAVDAMLLARKSLTSAPDVKTLQTAAAAHLRRNVNAALVAWHYRCVLRRNATHRISDYAVHGTCELPHQL